MFSAGSVLQLLGAVGVTVGAFLLLPAAGWVVGGGVLILVGVGMERGNAE